MCGTNVPNIPRPAAVAHMARQGLLRQARATSVSRRRFLRTAAAATAVVGTGTALRPWGTPALAQSAGTCVGTVPPNRRSIQLFTLNNDSMNDVDATFARLVELGYHTSEEAGYGNAGNPEDFKAALDRAGYRSTSTHKNIPYPWNEDDFRTLVADAQTIGITRIVEPLPRWALPFLGVGIATGGAVAVGPTSLQWQDFAQALNNAGDIATVELGQSVGYHNHTELFLPLADDPSRVGMDVLAEATDPELVHFEMDIYWVHAAGADPVEYIEKYPGRIEQFHVKDMAEDGSITAPGTGIIDFNRVFAAASVHQDIAEYIIEQDNASENEGGDMTAAELGMELFNNARWEYAADVCNPAAGGGDPAPEPTDAATDPAPDPTSASSDPTSDPDPDTVSPLPVTGGGMAGIGALALGSILALRNRRAH